MPDEEVVETPEVEATPSGLSLAEFVANYPDLRVKGGELLQVAFVHWHKAHRGKELTITKTSTEGKYPVKNTSTATVGSAWRQTVSEWKNDVEIFLSVEVV